MQELNIAGLKTRVARSRDGSGANPDSLVVLLHGYGAAGDDLVYLRDELELSRSTALVFPEGPLDLSETTTCAGNARGWWVTDSKQLHLAMLTGRPALASSAAGSGREAARSVFGAFMHELRSRFRVGSGQVVLGGFSQGAILCLDWALHDGEPLAGLFCLSGTLIGGCDWDACLATRSPLRILVSHGRHDPILPFSLAQELCVRLGRSKWDVEFVRFDGSHAIPREVVRATSGAATRWLSKALVHSSESKPEALAPVCSSNGLPECEPNGPA